MSLRTDLLPVVEAARKLTGSTELDQRPSRLTIRVYTWSGGQEGRGTRALSSELVLPQHYKIKEISSREVAASGGRYEMQDLRAVVTPEHSGGGYTQEQLDPTVEDGQQVVYVVSGQINGEFRRIELTADRAYRYTLVLRRLTGR